MLALQSANFSDNYTTPQGT